jgi:hypothetical protein
MNTSSTTPTPDADERRLLRCGIPAAGLFLVALGYAIWFLATTHPAIDTTPIDAATGFRDNAARVASSTLLFLLPLPFVLLFLSGLRSALRRAGDALASAAASAGRLDLGMFATAAVVSSITSTIGALEADPATGAVIKAVDGVLPLAIAIGGLARAVMLGSSAVLLARTGHAARPLIRFTWAVASLGALGAATFLTPALFPVCTLAMVLTWVWMGVIGMRLSGQVVPVASSTDRLALTS